MLNSLSTAVRDDHSPITYICIASSVFLSLATLTSDLSTTSNEHRRAGWATITTSLHAWMHGGRTCTGVGRPAGPRTRPTCTRVGSGMCSPPSRAVGNHQLTGRSAGPTMAIACSATVHSQLSFQRLLSKIFVRANIMQN